MAFFGFISQRAPDKIMNAFFWILKKAMIAMPLRIEFGCKLVVVVVINLSEIKLYSVK